MFVMQVTVRGKRPGESYSDFADRVKAERQMGDSKTTRVETQPAASKQQKKQSPPLPVPQTRNLSSLTPQKSEVPIRQILNTGSGEIQKFDWQPAQVLQKIESAMEYWRTTGDSRNFAKALNVDEVQLAFSYNKAQLCTFEGNSYIRLALVDKGGAHSPMFFPLKQPAKYNENNPSVQVTFLTPDEEKSIRLVGTPISIDDLRMQGKDFAGGLSEKKKT